MSTKMNNKFYLGLDIGTDSCGWALTDERYNLSRISGKDAWGVRLFESADVAAARRQKRTARRRLQRRRLQNEWLREVFSQEIEKVDPKFFDRLKYSNLYLEDKEQMGINSKYSLFNDILDEVYTDKEYYSKYKTVYHLRSELVKKPADDIRLLYLAVHSILTHRGHFLYTIESSENIDESKMFNDLVDKMGEIIVAEDGGKVFNIGHSSKDNFDRLYQDLKEGTSLRQTKETFAEGIGAKSKKDKDIVKIVVDGKFKLKDLFAEIEKEDNIEVNFSSDKYETEVYGKIIETLGDDDKVSIIDDFQKIYSSIQLKRLLGDHKYICQSLVEKYDMHSAQLREFKEFIKKYYPSKNAYVFRYVKPKKSSDGKKKAVNNYAAYVYSNLTNGKKQVIDEKSSKEDFYAFVKKEIFEKDPEIAADEEYVNYKNKVTELMAKGEFLQKVRSHENTVLPNSLYTSELEAILDANKEKFTFLTEKDETGLTNAEKIKQIIAYKVPYFVGPIGKSTEKFSWAEKQNDMPLRPWNLEKIVDFDKAEDKFIQRMTNKCTYLKDKDVLPKDSLLYSKFRVLNELNNLKINGDGITVELKQKIYNELFKKNKKVSVKRLKEFLVAENIVPKSEIANVSITGIDREFVNTLSSYVTLAGRFGEDFVDDNIEIFEKIIKYHTIISDKDRLAKRLEREFNIFSADDIKFLKSLNYSKWGRLSKEFLTELKFVDKRKAQKINTENFSKDYQEKRSNGEAFSVIEAMWETNNNLQQLFDQGNYTLAERVEEHYGKLDRDIVYADIDEMYCSPSVKRGAWQAIQVINEIKSRIGKYPDKIFVEVTRHDEVKGDAGRKDSRKKKIEKLYNSAELKKVCEELSVEYNELMRHLLGEDGKSGKTDAELRSDRLYLYFMQLGKCMYTGEPLEIDKIYDDNIYNIDHIIPQSKIKDDSLNNKVLVKMQVNKEKDNSYPINEYNPQIQIKQKAFWKMLNERGLLSNEKLARLCRTEPFNEREEIAFVNRQLVETNQESKAVTDLLRRVVGNPTSVVFSKAGFVSDFRKKFDIFKSRTVNSLHHAKDAYLNVVVGNIMDNRFTIPFFWDNTKDDINKSITRNTSKVFERVVKSPIDGSVVWNGCLQEDIDKCENDIKRIKEICSKNTCIVSIMPFVNNNGLFYDETIYKSAKNDPNTKASVPLKGDKKTLSNVQNYGGYNSLKGAYFTVVESIDKKGKTKKTIESVPILIEYTYRNDPDKEQKIIEYLEKQNNIKITKVILPVLKYKSTLKINGGLFTLSGKSDNRCALLKQNQWYIDNKYIGYIKAIEKYLSLSDTAKAGLVKGENSIIVSLAKSKDAKGIKLTKEENLKLYDMMTTQLSKEFYCLDSIKEIANKLMETREKFENMSIEDQIKLLNNIAGYIGGTYNVDLTLIGGSSKSGQTRISKNITDLDISVVMQSVAGFSKKEIKL